MTETLTRKLLTAGTIWLGASALETIIHKQPKTYAAEILLYLGAVATAGAIGTNNEKKYDVYRISEYNE
jgi:hypothetical protein